MVSNIVFSLSLCQAACVLLLPDVIPAPDPLLSSTAAAPLTLRICLIHSDPEQLKVSHPRQKKVSRTFLTHFLLPWMGHLQNSHFLKNSLTFASGEDFSWILSSKSSAPLKS